ncbi:MAG: Hint domain-containing protein [Sulfitobacter sp.]
MPGYISEFKAFGFTDVEFIEVALPEGTDPSGYTIQIYDGFGGHFATFPLGVSTNTMAGHDVYVVDAATLGFDDGGTSVAGNLDPETAIALVDDNGDVLQFISYLGNTVVGTSGPVNGLTSVEVGDANEGMSQQSDDGGLTYYAQSSLNPGTIPACYAAGSLIKTPTGNKPIENLRVGDLVLNNEGKPCSIRWAWSGTQPLEDTALSEKPVLIRTGALGHNRPSRDLIVSGQHRIVVGCCGQLEDIFDQPYMLPAKALTCLKGIRFMAGKKSIVWHHLLCDQHSIILANNLASETLLLGPMILTAMSKNQLEALAIALGRPVAASTIDLPVLPCLAVGEARRQLRNQSNATTRPTAYGKVNSSHQAQAS